MQKLKVYQLQEKEDYVNIHLNPSSFKKDFFVFEKNVTHGLT